MTILGTAQLVLQGNIAEFEKAMDRAVDKFQKTGRTLERIGRDFLPVSLAAGALGVGLIKIAADFETSFAGIRKTMDLTETEFRRLEQANRDLSKVTPVTANEINRIGEIAGQLGIRGVSNVVKFEDTIAKLARTTNLTAEHAALSLAQMAAIMELPQNQIDRLGSAVVDLGNNFETVETKIVDFALRISGAGQIAGLAAGETLGIATAFSSLGIEAEAGGTAVQKVLIALFEASAAGGKRLQTLAKLFGVTQQEFREAFNTRPGEVFLEFVQKLALEADRGVGALRELGLQDQRLIRGFVAVAEAGDQLKDAINRGTTAFDQNAALGEEARKRYATFDSQLQIFINRVVDAGNEVGKSLLPILKDLLLIMGSLADLLGKVAKRFAELPPVIRGVAAALIALTAAIAPLALTLGALSRVWSLVVSGAKFIFGSAIVKLIADMIFFTRVTTGLTAKLGVLATGFKLLFAAITPIRAAIALAIGATAAFLGWRSATSAQRLEARRLKEELDAIETFRSDFSKPGEFEAFKANRLNTQVSMLKGQLDEVKTQMQDLAFAGQGSTEEFEALADEAERLKSIIDDLEIKAAQAEFDSTVFGKIFKAAGVRKEIEGLQKQLNDKLSQKQIIEFELRLDDTTRGRALATVNEELRELADKIAELEKIELQLQIEARDIKIGEAATKPDPLKGLVDAERLKAIQKIIDDFNEAIRQAETMGEILGDTLGGTGLEFDVTAAKADAYKQALEALAALGFRPEDLTGIESKTLRKVGEAFLENAKKVEQAINARREAERQAKALIEEGISLTEKTKTAEEQLIRTKFRLHTLVMLGAIGWDTYFRALQNATDEFRESDPRFEEFNELIKINKDRVKEAIPPFQRYVETLERLRALQALGPQAGGITAQEFQDAAAGAREIFRDASDAVEFLNDKIKEYQDIVQSTQSPQQQFAQGVVILEVALRQGAITLSEFVEGMRALRGILQDQLEQMITVNDVFVDSMLYGLNSLGDAVADFVTGNKRAFADWSKAVIKDLIAVMVRIALFQLLTKAFPGVGLVMGFGGQIGLREKGGPVRRGDPYIVGEGGPEFFVPGASGTIIPNKQTEKLLGLSEDKNALGARSGLDNVIPLISGVGAPFTEARALFSGRVLGHASLMAERALEFETRAMGGPVFSGRSYLVGEQGREIFTSAQNTIRTASSPVSFSTPGGVKNYNSGSTSGNVTVGIDTSNLPPVPGPLDPRTAATHDWYRRLFSHLKVDYDDRGGR